MAENKKSFILYKDLIYTVGKMPDEISGKLFKHILEYVNCNNPKTDDVLLTALFEPIRQTLKRDLRKWEDNSQMRSDRAKKAGEASAKARQLKATQSNSLVQNSTQSTVSVSVSVSDIKHIVEFLNSTTGRKFKHNSTNMNKHLKARLKEGYTLDQFKYVIKIKTKEWLGTDMEKFLRPETLFGTKFDSYLNQKEQTSDDLLTESRKLGFAKFKRKHGMETALKIEDMK